MEKTAHASAHQTTTWNGRERDSHLALRICTTDSSVRAVTWSASLEKSSRQSMKERAASPIWGAHGYRETLMQHIQTQKKPVPRHVGFHLMGLIDVYLREKCTSCNRSEKPARSEIHKQAPRGHGPKKARS